MDPAITDDEWGELTKIVMDKVENHPDVEFVSSLALALGKTVHKRYQVFYASNEPL